MKEYPSITADIKYGVPIIAFSKYDGSQIRAEWNRKRGFNKFGTRHRLLGEDERPLGEAIRLIQNKYEKSLTDIFHSHKFEKVTCFFEFFGEHSAFGVHSNEKHDVVLFDIDVYKKGLVPAREFIKIIKNIEIPNIIFDGKVNDILVNKIKCGEIESMTFEGCVCKGPFERKLGLPLMFKIKTDAWLSRLGSFCGGDQKLFENLR